MEINFVSAPKIGGNTTSIINCYFFKHIYTLANKTYYLHVEKQVSLIISIHLVFLLLKYKESYRPSILQVFFTLS